MKLEKGKSMSVAECNLFHQERRLKQIQDEKKTNPKGTSKKSVKTTKKAPQRASKNPRSRALDDLLK